MELLKGTVAVPTTSAPWVSWNFETSRRRMAARRACWRPSRWTWAS